MENTYQKTNVVTVQNHSTALVYVDPWKLRLADLHAEACVLAVQQQHRLGGRPGPARLVHEPGVGLVQP